MSFSTKNARGNGVFHGAGFIRCWVFFVVISPPKKNGKFLRNYCEIYFCIPSRELTCPTLGRGKSSSNVIFGRDMLVSITVNFQSDEKKQNRHL